MFIGYARVSTSDQTLDLQKDALQKAGCDRIFTDTASGAKSERKGLDEALTYVRPGDTLVCISTSRLVAEKTTFHSKLLNKVICELD